MLEWLRKQPHRSGDDIGQKPIFNCRDAILQGKFLLFQPLDEQLICCWVGFEGYDLVIELTMLAFERDQFFPKLALVAPLHMSDPAPA